MLLSLAMLIWNVCGKKRSMSILGMTHMLERAVATLSASTLEVEMADSGLGSRRNNSSCCGIELFLHVQDHSMPIRTTLWP